MVAYTRVELINQSLAKIRADSITTYEDNTLSGREARRFYPMVMSKVLAGPAEFSFANQRIALNETTNDRPYEYGFAYTLPSNMASPLRVLPDFEGVGIGIPIPLVGEPYAETWASGIGQIEMPYVIEGSTLYTNTEAATLEYIINDVSGVTIPEQVVDYIVAELGSKLAVPVKGNSQREKELRTDAEVELQRAIADDRNRHPNSSGQYVSETILARSGAWSG